MEDEKGHLLKKLIDAVNEISSISDYRCCIKRQFCNLAKRLKLLTPMFEEIRESKEPLSDDALKSIAVFSDALDSTKDFLRFGREGSKIYLDKEMLKEGSIMEISVEEKGKAEASDFSEVASAPADVNGEASEALDDNEESTDPFVDQKEG